MRELPRTTREEPRKRRRGKFILVIVPHPTCRDSVTIRLNRAQTSSLLPAALNFREFPRNNSFALLDRNDLIDWNAAQAIYLPARPSDHERLNCRSLPQTKMNARIAGGHVAHAAL